MRRCRSLRRGRSAPRQESLRAVRPSRSIASRIAGMETTPSTAAREALSKVPAVTFGFWLIKVAATTLGETAGDWVSMSLKLGYLVGSAIFAVLFIGFVTGQVKSGRFNAWLYWPTIIATTTLGTTMADFADRSLAIGYPGGVAIISALLAASPVHVASRGGQRVGRPRQATAHRVVLLGHDPVLADAGHGAGRLGGRRGWRRHGPGLRERRADLRRRAGGRLRPVPVDACVAHDAVLGRLHPHAPTRARRWATCSTSPSPAAA